MLFVFSVGGGSLAHNVSPNLVRALEYGRQIGAQIVGVVGRDGGYTAQVADACGPSFATAIRIRRRAWRISTYCRASQRRWCAFAARDFAWWS